MSNVPNQISLESASRKDSTERRKTKKIFFLCFYAEGPSPMVDYTQRRKTKRKKNLTVPNQISLESATRKTLRGQYYCSFIFFVDWLSSRVDNTERRKTKRKQRKISQIKIHKDLHQGELPQREESLRKTYI
jgi:hypothetical protein